MRRRSTVFFLAIAVGLLLAIPVPASAKPPLRGDQDLVLKFDGPGGPPICLLATGDAISWVGTIVFEGDAHAYGIAYLSLLPPPDPLKKAKASHFADEWMIFENPLTGDCPGDGDAVVMWGFDKGVQSDVNLKARANGTVEWVADVHSFFDKSLEGRQVHWSGVTGASGLPLELTFEGPFRIN